MVSIDATGSDLRLDGHLCGAASPMSAFMTLCSINRQAEIGHANGPAAPGRGN